MKSEKPKIFIHEQEGKITIESRVFILNYMQQKEESMRFVGNHVAVRQ